MQHYGHSICHFRPMVVMMATMGKRKLTKHTKAMSRNTQKTMVIRVNVNRIKWSNQERSFFSFLFSSSNQGGAGAGLQYPAYFKDAKGNNHSVFGSNSLGSLQYLKQGQKGMLPDVLQQGRNAGMPLYVRCPICQKEFKQKSTLLQHGCIHIESRYIVIFLMRIHIICYINPKIFLSDRILAESVENASANNRISLSIYV